MSKELLEDYLDEDKPIPNQKFFVLSYLLPGENNEIEVPMIKMRGVYKTMEECRSKIESLKNIDKYFHMYISEVGKWGGLFDDETVAKLDNVDVQYREEIMNNMMRGYKENKDKADLDFIERTRIMKEKAKFEGTPEGQEYLAKLKEEPVSVKARLDSVNFQLKDLNERIAELENIKKATEEVYNQFTEEELQDIQKKLGESSIGK